MTAGGTLRPGLRVLVTRPADQADTLCRAIRDQRGIPIALPLLEIAPLQEPELPQRLRDALSADWWIFTSANAVRHAHHLLPAPWRPRVAALGAATASALRAVGQSVAVVPTRGASSEALLAEPAFRHMTGQHVAVITGAEGRNVLPESLAARGARVDVIPVYRRIPVQHSDAKIAAALHGADVAVVTSGEALAHLVTLTPSAQRATLLNLQLVLPSRRVVEQAVLLGFVRPPRIAEPMSDAAILRCLGDDQKI